MRSWSLTGSAALALVLGLLFARFSGSRWNSWPETITAGAFVVTACFLAGMSVGGATRSPYARVGVVVFASSFLVWPALNGMLREFAALEFFGILEVLPTLVGGLTGIALQKPRFGLWLPITAALGAVSIPAIGPPR